VSNSYTGEVKPIAKQISVPIRKYQTVCKHSCAPQFYSLNISRCCRNLVVDYIRNSRVLVKI